MSDGANWADLLGIGFVALLFAPMWLGELISELGSYRQQVRRAQTQQSTQGWSRTRHRETTAKHTVYRPTPRAEPPRTAKDNEQTRPEHSPSPKPTELRPDWSWEDSRDEEFYARLRTQAGHRKRAIDAVISQWRRKHGFPAFGIADPAKAGLLERYILMLGLDEQVVLILEYGLLDGRRRSRHEIAETLMTIPEGVSNVKQTALWKIDAFHKHAEIKDLLGLMWVYEKKAWINHLYSTEDRRALRREGKKHYRALARAEERARQWLEVQTEPARKRETVNAERPHIPACRLIDCWQIVRGLERRNYSRQGILKANDIEKCLALFDFTESPVAREAWLTQLVRHNPDLKQRHVAATGAVKPAATKHREWATIEAIETASDTEWLLSNVSSHQRLVLELAFGITTPGCFSDDEIAQLMDISLQEVTELKLYALEKMRALAMRQNDRGYR